jgi:hypothetical protein
MRARIWLAVSFTLLVSLASPMAALAKGEFAFLTIEGGDLAGTLRSNDKALTTDFFAFADFSRAPLAAPADPGRAYLITRYYIDHGREAAFDQLHYYPEAGLVYFDGLVNGFSDYDGQWYSANPQIRPVFEFALANPTSKFVTPTLRSTAPATKDAYAVAMRTLEAENAARSQNAPSRTIAPETGGPAQAPNTPLALLVFMIGVGISAVVWVNRSRPG